MPGVRDHSIKRKLIRISLLTTGAALLLANMILMTHELILFRRSLVNDLRIEARMIGRHCTSALLFNDPKAAGETLSVLQTAPNIIQAVIYSTAGKIFAAYQRPGAEGNSLSFPFPGQGFQFGINSLRLSQQIVFNGKIIGTVYFHSDLSKFYSLLLRYGLMVSLALGISLLVALILLSKLHQVITRPINTLVQLMGIISKDKNYSLRAPVLQKDELGSMAEGFNDMLEQIQIRDRELEGHRQHLEEQVGVRTADLAKANSQLEKELADRRQAEVEKTFLEEQLRQSQKMEAIGRLAGGVAHDFNNILTIIQGYSELAALKLQQGEQAGEAIDQIIKAGERASDLTRQLLAFSRRQMLEMKVIDLNILLKDLDKMLRRILGEDIEVVHSLAEDLGKIKTDPGQIEQVILNLTVNARDAMPYGGKLLIETDNVELDKTYAQTHAGVQAGPYVRLSVTDTGAGMPPEVKDRIFEPFFTTKELGKGTGLGLSTIYGIVKQSGGNIWVYSEENLGTTFKIYLPRIDQTAESNGFLNHPQELPKGSETILVAEDEKEVGKIIRKTLQTCGYEVLLAADGREAIRLVQEYPNESIQLLITDVVMPGMSGRELRDHLLTLRPEMKVIFMSGYTDDAVIHHGVLRKEMHFIQKPFPMNALAQKVREILDGG